MVDLRESWNIEQCLHVRFRLLHLLAVIEPKERGWRSQWIVRDGIYNDQEIEFRKTLLTVWPSLFFLPTSALNSSTKSFAVSKSSTTKRGESPSESKVSTAFGCAFGWLSKNRLKREKEIETRRVSFKREHMKLTLSGKKNEKALQNSQHIVFTIGSCCVNWSISIGIWTWRTQTWLVKKGEKRWRKWQEKRWVS